jgi:CheY-like chemotaxis protein
MSRILVIEDNPTNLQLMVYLLQAYRHSTLQAMDGETGLEAARQGRPDLILCDVELPKMDGLQVARALKHDPRMRAVPLVAVTALAMVGDRERMLQAGFDGYLSKPIQPQEFIGQVERFLPPEERGRVARPHEPAAAEASPAAAPCAARGLVLVVDDAPMNLELARWILEPKGYAVLLVHSTADALEMARRERPDLILSDLHMPGGDGFELLAALQGDPELRDIPFAFLSATFLGDSDCDRALAKGAKAFLQRPISATRLLAEVAALIGKGREEGGAE